MTQPSGIAVFWFRRDLRLFDNAGFYKALTSGLPVLPIFIFDKKILSDLNDPSDARVTFLHDQLLGVHQTFSTYNSGLTTIHAEPIVAWRQLLTNFPIKKVFFNRDYEPYATERDDSVADFLLQHGITTASSKDHVIFEYDEILKTDNSPYTVYTPYSKKWLGALNSGLAIAGHNGQIRRNQSGEAALPYYPSQDHLQQLLPYTPPAFPSLAQIGFQKSAIAIPPLQVRQGIIRKYDQTRDYPGLNEGTSKLGIHYRFGTVSIREKVLAALDLNRTYAGELIWREFFSMILAHFPGVVGKAFRPEYDNIEWRHDPEGLAAWKAGCTGYPLVDAGMRELLATGYQHNRVRMVTASFLTKHLLIDWRFGEAWFAEKLLDFDLASNNGNWQWAAGCGTDAAPYFRIFNPISQQEKFDQNLSYIKKWVPEFGTPTYPKPIVEHSFARERCLNAYKKGLGRT